MFDKWYEKHIDGDIDGSAEFEFFTISYRHGQPDKIRSIPIALDDLEDWANERQFIRADAKERKAWINGFDLLLACYKHNATSSRPPNKLTLPGSLFKRVFRALRLTPQFFHGIKATRQLNSCFWRPSRDHYGRIQSIDLTFRSSHGQNFRAPTWYSAWWDCAFNMDISTRHVFGYWDGVSNMEIANFVDMLNLAAPSEEVAKPFPASGIIQTGRGGTGDSRSDKGQTKVAVEPWNTGSDRLPYSPGAIQPLTHPLFLPTVVVHLIVEHVNNQIRVPTEMSVLNLEGDFGVSRFDGLKTSPWDVGFEEYKSAAEIVNRSQSTLLYTERRFDPFYKEVGGDSGDFGDFG